jgi:hypothetical protein
MLYVTWPYIKNYNLHFDSKLDCEEKDYMHDMDLQIVVLQLHVSYPTRSRCKTKSGHWGSAYLVVVHYFV